MALWWHRPLRRPAQTDNSASPGRLFSFYCQNRKFIVYFTQMKTLATLSANGFRTFFFKVASVINGRSTRTNPPPPFPSCFQPLRRQLVSFLTDVATSWGSGRDGVCWRDAFKWNVKMGNVVIAAPINSRNALVSCTRLIYPRARKRSTARRAKKREYIGPIHCVRASACVSVNMACVCVCVY